MGNQQDRLIVYMRLGEAIERTGSPEKILALSMIEINQVCDVINDATDLLDDMSIDVGNELINRGNLEPESGD